MPSTMQNVYRRLLTAFGPQHWWPGETPFEVLVGAVLTQNVSWKNVEKAIANLRERDLLSPTALYEVDVAELEELIRPAGYYSVKARRLRNLLKLIVGRYDGSLEKLFALDVAALREELLAVNGIGPETADSIVCYAANKLSFVVDAYTFRILGRHGWLPPEAGYYEVKEYVENELPQDVQVYNEMHALLVNVGKDYCKKSRPLCEKCPLKPLLPKGGPVEYDISN